MTMGAYFQEKTGKVIVSYDRDIPPPAPVPGPALGGNDFLFTN